MEKNFMQGNNYKLSPLLRMKMVWSSGIIGEPQYYRTKEESSDIFIVSLQDALEHDFGAVLDFAVELRTEFNMRLGPQIMLVEAAVHKNRVEFNRLHPKVFRDAAKKIIQLPTDIKSQLDYYIKKNGDKTKLPNILKTCWKEFLERMTEYHVDKYKNKAKIVDLIRLSHPDSKKNELITNLVKNFPLPESHEQTWEKMKSNSMSWGEILTRLDKKFPHMALLRNINNIATSAPEHLDRALEILEQGVLHGKQFPFRYYTAYTQTSNEKVRQSLERCMQQALANFPNIEGRVVSLCDNSGSAWGTFSSQYGKQTVATIGNLSGLMTAFNASEGGSVGIFGDRLEMYEVSKTRGILEQLEELNAIGKRIGHATENGIWLWFKNGFENAEFNHNVDHLFIYSDMQAGHGGLYGSNPAEYKQYCRTNNPSYIDVIRLIDRHRDQINSKLNVFTVQTAAYDNSLIPELLSRTAIMAGWTGNEIVYATKMIGLWNIADNLE